MPRLSGLIIAIAAIVLAGCEQAPPPPGPLPDLPTAMPSRPSPSPSTANELTLAFGGDVHFVDHTLPLLNDPKTAFGPFAKQLTAADWSMVNLETAITERGEKQPKNFHFRAPASAYQAVQAAGVDMVSIANNHTLDYGQIGLLDTLDGAKAANVPVVGAGRNVTEAYEPYVTTVKGVKLGVVALSQVWELAGPWKATATKPGIAMAHDRKLSVAAVKKARSLADVVIVYLHWGTEDVNCPNTDQKSIAKELAAAGADIIVGTHSHVPQGDGFSGKTYVHYGLGNFLWARSGSKDTGLLLVTVRRDGQVTGREFVVGTVSETGQPIPVFGPQKDAIQKRLDESAKCTGLAEAPTS